MRQQQRPNVDNGHYQQSFTPAGLLGELESPPTLARLLTTLIGTLEIAAAACAKASYGGELSAPPQMCTVCRCQEPQTHRQQNNTGSGVSPQPTMTVASSRSRCVQVLAPSSEASYGQYITRCNKISLCIINVRKRYARDDTSTNRNH